MTTISFDIGIKNLAYCICYNLKIIEWNVITICDTKVSNKELRILIFTELEKFKFSIFKYNIKYVLIESQPALINGKMKSIEDMIYSWFYIRGILDFNMIKEIYLINPRSKLYFIYKTKTKYSILKKQSINLTKIILKYLNYTNDLIKLNSYKKQDDLCDCYLQYFYWYYKHIIGV